MSVNEFKAWLEGYVCCFKDDVPNKEQWHIVQEKINTIYPSKVK